MNIGKPPAEYVELFRHHFPDIPKAAINEAWKHCATPLEYRLTLERIRHEA